MIHPEALMDVVADVDDAIRRGDAASLRSFVAEAEASGLAVTARRGRAALVDLAKDPRQATRDIRRRLDELQAPPRRKGPAEPYTIRVTGYEVWI